MYANSGPLWFDNTSSDIVTKIQNAERRYKEKFGTLPDVAFVNPKDFTEAKVKTITVKAKATIMPNHIWLGVER